MQEKKKTLIIDDPAYYYHVIRSAPPIACLLQKMLASSVTNPNAYWLNSRGMWAGYTFSVVFLFILVNCIPVLSIPVVWTITHGIHNIVRTVNGVGYYISFYYYN